MKNEPNVTSRTSWAQVCHTGMTAAAIVLSDVAPELAQRTVRRAVEAMPDPMSVYAPDGAPRWTLFTYNNLCHNTLSFDGRFQSTKGYSRLESWSSQNPDFVFATTDLTSHYPEQIARARRGVAIVDCSYVWVRDEIEADSARVIRWSMVTSAEPRIDRDRRSILLTQGNERLTLRVVSQPRNLQLKVWSTKPPTEYENPNLGTCIVGFECEIAPRERVNLDVLLIPEGMAGSCPGQNLAEWR